MSDAWRREAACLGEDPEIFFPRRGDNLAVQAARAICARCTVRQPCLDEAMREELGSGNLTWIVGIRGGLSGRQRRDLYAKVGICATCGGQYGKGGKRTRYCSDECRSVANRESHRRAQATYYRSA